jgi:hypothetical protein
MVQAKSGDITPSDAAYGPYRDELVFSVDHDQR